MMRLSAGFVLLAAVVAAGCSGEPRAPQQASSPPASASGSIFGDDLAFLQAHTQVIALASADGQSRIAIAPDYQGRVMTSTSGGSQGLSYGYIHRPVIEQGTRQPHMTVLGGEDRFWLGPEGGQYALYFPKGSAFDTDHWQVPDAIDWGAWPVTSKDDRRVTFTQPMTLVNYTGTEFKLRVDRTVRLLERRAVEDLLAERFKSRNPGAVVGASLDASVKVVAYESENTITNTGAAPWTREGGLVSIWILGMLRPAPRTTVVIPYQPGAVSERGPVVNDAYFGAPPADRLKIGDAAIFFRGDGTSRGKIGVPRPRATDVAASYDPDSGVLTIIQLTLPPAPDGYVNSMWALQKDPYGGDVINSYNDGPLGPGQPPLGPFYEVESSSPAAALRPQGTMRHVHRTMHLQGSPAALDGIAKAVLGVSIDQIVNSLRP